MKLSRLLRHLALPHWLALRAFPKPALRAIEHAIKASEVSHRGELRFVVEANLPLDGPWRGPTPRERALD
ncbi:MAG: hypothetical protein HZC24_10190, partial [Rhodocyclales bacterium]|nr:hypothetical protein [Rhodocyclales bacterium]